MKSLAVVLLAAAIAITGCASTNAPQNAGDKEFDAASRIQLKAELDALKVELQELRGSIQDLKGTVAGIQAQVHDLSAEARNTGTGVVAKNAKTQEWFDTVAKVSDVVRVWMGEVNGVEFYICPVTKAKETQVLRDQLGDDYAYMWLTIINNSPNQAYKFDPKMALLRLEFESDTPDGEPKFAASFDPRQVIKVKTMQNGENALDSHFKERELLPGESMQTHVLFPKNVDFTKVKAIYMNNVLIPELKQQ